MTTKLSQHEIQELTEPMQRFALWVKTSIWLPNDFHNNIIRKYWIKYIGSEAELNKQTQTGCSSCQKWIRIYRDINRELWTKQ